MPVLYFTELLAEALSYSDLDYLIIDCEHGPYDVESTMRMLPGMELQGKSALVRTRDTSRTAILPSNTRSIRSLSLRIG